MKKTLIAMAALAAVSGAAQADVQLYGILDVGVANQSAALNASDTFPVTIDNNSIVKTTKSITTMVNGPLSDSRWGIKGSEDLGNGMNAHFTLESGINLPTGQLNNAALSQINATAGGGVAAGLDSSLSGQLFGRLAFVGVTTPYGTLDFGRNMTPGGEVLGAYDPLKGAQLFSPIGFSGSQGGALGYTEVLRNDNSIKYSGKFNNVNLKAIYKIGGIAGNTSAGSGYGLNIGYEAGNFGVQAVYQAYKDVVATAGAASGSTNANQGIKGTLYDTQGWALVAKYLVSSDMTIKAGYEHYKRKNASDTAASLGSVNEFGYTFSATTGNLLDAGLAGDKNYHIALIGGDYNLTPSLNLSLGYYDVALDAYGAGNNDTDQRFASALLDYSLSKRTDVYVGYANQAASGAGASGAQTVSTVAIGMRHKF